MPHKEEEEKKEKLKNEKKFVHFYIQAAVYSTAKHNWDPPTKTVKNQQLAQGNCDRAAIDYKRRQPHHRLLQLPTPVAVL